MPNDWFYLQRAYPEKTLDLEAWRAAQEQARYFRENISLENLFWQEAGPTNIGGRITALAAHPQQPQTIWAGAADGGVWKSNNGGGEWIPVFDFAPSLSIGALAIDPNDPNIVYVGTGEANASGDSYPGDGIYRTIDGGVHWDYLGLPQSYYIGRIAINPQNSNTIFVAATGLLFGKNPERGIYRSHDGGANWQRVLFISDSTAGIDVVINPQDTTIIYAAIWERIRRPWNRQAGGITSGIYKSVDGGNTWQQLTQANGLPANSPTIGRIGLSISPTNPDVLYAIYADHPGYFAGVYKTTNGGQNWARVNDGALSNLFSSFGWYFGQIYVDPVDPNTVYALGVDHYKSGNGGNSWSEIAWQTHVDHHAIWVDPNNTSKVIIGNDGGIFLSNNGGSSFQKVLNLPLSQFYAMTVDYNNPERRYGGTQDNGTLRTMTGQINDWERIYGGDGFYVIVDPTNSNVIYAEYQYGGLGKSTNGGLNFNPATSGINSSDRRNWMVPVVMDPNNPNTLYYGTFRVYRTTNAASNWTSISPDLSNGPYPGGLNFGTITTITVANSNSNVIYAGTDDGNVWVSNDYGNTWMNRSSQLPNRWITRVAVDPSDENTVLVSYSGYKYNEYIGYVYKSNDMGLTWIDITNNLPQAPINVVIVDPAYTDSYFVGTDVGVFFTVDGGQNWHMVGNNLPNSVVADLVLHHPTRTLTAATHGRSMYKINIANITEVARAAKTTQPSAFQLTQNYPNPFNSWTRINYYIPYSSVIKLTVYDILGRTVISLAEGNHEKGWYQLEWNGKDRQGRPVSSGTYIYSLEGDGFKVSKKMILVE
ncbi:MAG: exo-alpha-sialidase [Calditrichia bacterium]